MMSPLPISARTSAAARANRTVCHAGYTAMTTLTHDLLQYIWGILLVVGFIFSALVWIAMAAWDNIRTLFRRISGEHSAPRGDDPYGR